MGRLREQGLHHLLRSQRSASCIAGGCNSCEAPAAVWTHDAWTRQLAGNSSSQALVVCTIRHEATATLSSSEYAQSGMERSMQGLRACTCGASHCAMFLMLGLESLAASCAEGVLGSVTSRATTCKGGASGRAVEGFPNGLGLATCQGDPTPAHPSPSVAIVVRAVSRRNRP